MGELTKWDFRHLKAKIRRYALNDRWDAVDNLIASLNPSKVYYLSEGCDNYAMLIIIRDKALFLEVTKENKVHLSEVIDGYMDKTTACKLAHYIIHHQFTEVKT